MTCLADDMWQINLPDSAQPVGFKFLINDSTWSLGPDYVIIAGKGGTFEPTF
ncbi:MAG: hypothetical protein ABIR80_17240 [Opitutaceae bacterium]